MRGLILEHLAIVNCGGLKHQVWVAYRVPVYKVTASAQLCFVLYKSDWRNLILGDLSGIVHSFLVDLKELYVVLCEYTSHGNRQWGGRGDSVLKSLWKVL